MDYSQSLPLIVIVDDEIEVINAIKRCLMRVDCHIEGFTSPLLALSFIEEHQPVVVISDQMMPHLTGEQLLTKVQVLWPKTKRVLLSAYQDFDVVINAFNEDVIEQFIEKPWKNVDLQRLVEQSISEPSKKADNQSSIGMVGSHQGMVKLYEQIQLAAQANVPIFIYGETGTGKELVAKACHQMGIKSDGDFVAINCATLTEQLIESQLFGHKKGAFTGAVADQKGVLASAHNGTVFLDEITTMPLALQSKLLRAIQERSFSPVGSMETVHFDALIVSASSTSLADAVKAGEFREDLYYRLNVIPLSIPPLRARGEDISLLAQHFLEKYSMQHGKSFTQISEGAKQVLQANSWPGNVRQLENAIHASVAINNGQQLEADMIAPMILDAHNVDALPNSNSAIGNTPKSIKVEPLESVERQAIEQAIAACEGNVTKAAALLEINPSTIYRKIKQWQ